MPFFATTTAVLRNPHLRPAEKVVALELAYRYFAADSRHDLVTGLMHITISGPHGIAHYTGLEAQAVSAIIQTLTHAGIIIREEHRLVIKGKHTTRLAIRFPTPESESLRSLAHVSPARTPRKPRTTTEPCPEHHLPTCKTCGVRLLPGR